MRKFRSIALAVLFLATSAGPLLARTDVSVLCFNIRYGTANDGENSWPNRDHLVKQIIRNHDADVVGLQEALDFQLAAIIDACPEYAVIGVGRDDGKTRGEYSAILYRADRFAVDSSGTFWLSDTPEIVASTSWGNSITRICTWARLIDRQSGEAFYVFNTHFDHRSQPSRERSSRLIAERIADRAHADPAVLMGDFNAGETNPAITILRDDAIGPGLVHTFRAVHPDESEVGTFNSFRGESDGEMIDHIFVTSDVEILNADIDRTNDNGRYPSDHFPVWASLRLN